MTQKARDASGDGRGAKHGQGAPPTEGTARDGPPGTSADGSRRRFPRRRWIVAGIGVLAICCVLFVLPLGEIVMRTYYWTEIMATADQSDNATRESYDSQENDSAQGSSLAGALLSIAERRSLQQMHQQQQANTQPQYGAAEQGQYDASDQAQYGAYNQQQYGAADQAPYGAYAQPSADSFTYPPTVEPWREASSAWNTEEYDRIVDNPFRGVGEAPLSTFSIDVDTASYANVRRFLTAGNLPPKDAVRIEEMVNYFVYDYAGPEAEADTPFAAHVEVASAPWQSDHRLVRIGIKGREIEQALRPAANLVFLLDVSGSMQDPNKLPLVKQSLEVLVEQLRPDDRVAIAVYAGASGLVLPSTPVSEMAAIRGAIQRLEAGGSTNGGQGIQLAYNQAKAHMIEGGINRVILATDGDFNVGVTDTGSLVRMVEDKAKSGVFLSVLGYGMGNFNDSMLEKLADKGNGNYAYIDTVKEAHKVLAEQVNGTLVTIAKDVKIQVEFNPAQVAAWRLIGYENRLLADEDFNDDTKDAGEIGAGHTVTALYEVVPVGVPIRLPGVDPLRYQQTGQLSQVADSGEFMNLKIRFKPPTGLFSQLIEFPVADSRYGLESVSSDFRFAAAVAELGMLLRESPYRGNATIEQVVALAQSGIGADPGGHRTEFLQLVDQTAYLLP